MAAVLSIRRSVSNASVTADVIVGFPGEGEGDFDQSFLLCETIGFAALHVFPYSVRPGTSAAHFEDKVPSEVKSERVQRLMELAKLQGRAFRSSLIGSVRPVLWEEGRESDGGTEWRGLTDNYIRVQALALDDLTNTITPARLIAQQEDLVHTQVLPIPN
jgi:threonylcarbamoyladenosine tRNA methylthiotransferase MtaB